MIDSQVKAKVKNGRLSFNTMLPRQGVKLLIIKW
jgi:hypothetical protein